MTREQLDALEALLAKATTGPWEVEANCELIRALRNNAADLIAMARRALELDEALEWLAFDGRLIFTGDKYCCWKGAGRAHSGATPLEAIQNARREHAE